MPLYLVRWPTFTASLISADSEAQLLDRLDELGDPGGCKWELYEGPIWIDFTLPEEIRVDHREDIPESTKELTLQGVSTLAEQPNIDLRVELPDGADTALTMRELVFAKAFPHLYKFLEQAARRKSADSSYSPRKLEDILRKELQGYVDWHKRRQDLESRSDLEAMVLRQMGLTVATPSVQAALSAAAEMEEHSGHLVKALDALIPAGAESAFAGRRSRLFDEDIPF